MDEKIYCDEIRLNRKYDLKVVIMYAMKLKKIIRTIELKHGDELISDNIIDIIEFREELYLFKRGDAQNKILKIAKRTLEGQEVTSLCYTNPDREKSYCYSQSEAYTMYTIINLTLFQSKLYDISELLIEVQTVNYNLHLRNMFIE